MASTSISLQRLRVAADKAAAGADAAKQRVRTAKTALKIARKVFKVARKMAKLARKNVEEARLASLPAASPAPAAPTKSRTSGLQRAAAITNPRAKRPQSASQVAKAVITRMSAAGRRKSGDKDPVASVASVAAVEPDTAAPDVPVET